MGINLGMEPIANFIAKKGTIYPAVDCNPMLQGEVDSEEELKFGTTDRDMCI